MPCKVAHHPSSPCRDLLPQGEKELSLRPEHHLGEELVLALEALEHAGQFAGAALGRPVQLLCGHALGAAVLVDLALDLDQGIAGAISLDRGDDLETDLVERFADAVVAKLSARWHVYEVPHGRGALPLKCH